MNLIEQANLIQDELVKFQRHVHKHPEVGFEVENTAKYIYDYLKEIKCDVKLIDGNGVLAEIGPKSGKTIMIRADIDALPIKEETDLEYQSVNENMHACGHDLHIAMGIGAAKLLLANEDKLKGRVKILFQPAEELLVGGKKMVDEGVLENPKVDACLAVHVLGNPQMPNGAVIFPGSGAIMASSDWFEITVKGKGGHGAMPHSAIDPLSAASNINISLDAIIAKEVSAEESAVLSACVVGGGLINNVIPDEAVLKGTIRTFSEETRNYIKQRVEEMAVNIAKAYRCSATINYTNGCPAVNVDKDLKADVVKYCQEFSNEIPVIDIEAMHGKAFRAMGSDDFSHYANSVPSVYFGIVATKENNGKLYPAHHSKVIFDESILSKGSATLTNIAIKYLEEK